MALINLRNALMSGKRLPYDAEVEFLESTGTQYINTGIKANTTTTRLDIELMLTQSTANMGLFGSRNASGTLGSSSCNAFFLSANQAFRMDWANGGCPFFNCLPNTAYSISITRGSVTINGSTTTYTNIHSVDQENNFLIFSFAEGSGVVYKNGMIGRVFGAKIYSNGVLVRDYIPVRRGTVGYLYDRVSGKLFGNAGSGDFVVGPDVVPVEYIESHGTEYIDTGLLGRDGYDFEYRFRPQNPLPCSIGGEYKDDKNCYIGIVRSNGNLVYNYYTPNIIVEVQSLTLGTDYNVKAHLYSGEQYFEVNGVRGGVGSRTGVFTSSYNLYLFAINNANQPASLGVMRLYNLTARLNTIPARSFLPVRVGTEGAMMDVLTRRIYRNAGTGAFTFGNDLKYPIPAE